MTLMVSDKTMDSREIAELTGKEHRNILRDVESQLGQLEGGLLRFEQTYTSQQNGQEYRCYKLPYRETMILISGYSVELRSKVIDRWMELEKATKLPRNRSGLSGALVAELIRANDKGLLTRHQFQEALGVTPDRTIATQQQPIQTTPLGLPVSPEVAALADSLLDGVTSKDRRQVHAVASKVLAQAASRQAVDQLNGKLSFGGAL